MAFFDDRSPGQLQDSAGEFRSAFICDFDTAHGSFSLVDALPRSSEIVFILGQFMPNLEERKSLWSNP